MLSHSQIVRADAFRHTGSTARKAFWSALLRTPGFRFTYVMRKVAALAPRRKSPAVFAYLFYRVWFHRLRFRYGLDISPQTKIGPGFYIGHFGGVVISPYAVLGSNVNVAQGVTIGAISRGEKKGTPTLGDRVWVGSHAIVVGKITIGDDALIAPGAFVNFDVPPNSVVLGNPGKIVSQTGSVGYINNIVDPERGVQ